MYGFNNNNLLWAVIILILIVLQWFRVGGGVGGPGGIGPEGGLLCNGGGVGGPGGIGPEGGLLCNGGLFIIALFILIACSCFKGVMPMPMQTAPARYC